MSAAWAAGVTFIGDVHGWSDRLDRLLPRCDGHLVFLGDLIDRGPDSAGVVRRVRALVEAGRASCLIGNHEWILCRALGLGAGARQVAPVDGPLFDRWAEAWGGAAVLRSYGARDAASLRDLMGGDLPFLADLPWVLQGAVGGKPWLAVHAGLDEARPYQEQVDHLALGWAGAYDPVDPRPPCLFSKRFLDGMARQQPRDLCVVSGHTPLIRVIATPQRILCDTSGGVPDRPLSAVHFPDLTVVDSGR